MPIIGIPDPADVTAIVTLSGTGLTDAQLRAAVVNVNDLQLPAGASWLPDANIANVSDASAHDLFTAQGSSVKIYVAAVIVVNAHATVGTKVSLVDDDTAPKTLFHTYAAPAGGGVAIGLPDKPFTAANKKLQVICGTTGADVSVWVAAYKL